MNYEQKQASQIIKESTPFFEDLANVLHDADYTKLTIQTYHGKFIYLNEQNNEQKITAETRKNATTTTNNTPSPNTI
jgi:hypothetical protein